ncbi:helix-turn-helix transcriptional regulator [Solirubrobacter ginsenosidimutans]|uniref:Helix-turn-helix transcriptional regulator n=1 Tax=Solirubrobacter ginsenosidimutans TaxID=490573 RepID=A0A9X3S7R5_9ACTN|nr:helix-turn-helix transcriptional regulator [Solirubrobacter ginsenosidimutans]MDA0163648.1 helix-turn-helix transcriptional regulator [Solirubrobacter ginsenosidimutans]
MYREFAPPPDLAPYVACVWTTVHRGGMIFPDGCVDLVWHGTRLVVAGPATGPVDPSIAVGDRVWGVRFRLGLAGAALGLPAGELTDSTVPITQVWGSWVDERVALGGMPALLEIVRERLHLVEIDPLARAAALGMAGPGARVDALGAALGVSERQLRRRFTEAVGYGPKTLARILRFQRFLALAADGGELARLALLAGYADQAHLTRETRRLAGRTPLELVSSRATPAGERLAV